MALASCNQAVMKFRRKFSISSGKSHFTSIDWIPAFAGMTDTYPTSSFPRKRESRSHYPDFLRSYVSPHKRPRFFEGANFKMSNITFNFRHFRHFPSGIDLKTKN